MKKFYQKEYLKYFLIFIILISNTSNTFAVDDPCEAKTGYDMYECRVKNICENYKTNKVVYNTESFKKAEKYDADSSVVDDVLFVSNRNELPLKKAVAVYKENMNNIYRCAIINSQLNSMNLMKKTLLNLDKVGDLKKTLEPKIDAMSNKLDIVFKSSKCSNIDKESIYNKQNILKQTTYETCNYNYYMEYLKEYYSDINNSLGLQKKDVKKEEVYVATEVANVQKNIFNGIDDEIEQAYKTFPLAFNAYSEFENNFPIHFLLEVIKEDYRIFRDKLYQTVSPIDQVVYKISNAMGF